MELGADHADTLGGINNLVSTYLNQGRLEEAEQLFRQIIETRKTTLGIEHPNTLTSINNFRVDIIESGPVRGGGAA